MEGLKSWLVDVGELPMLFTFGTWCDRPSRLDGCHLTSLEILMCKYDIDEIESVKFGLLRIVED